MKNPNIQVGVVFEDEEILVLDKPAGAVVNRSETTRSKTVQDWVEKYLGVVKVKKVGKGEENFLARSGVVHRLDKETSGLLLIAKTPESFASLQGQFKEKKVRKNYLALVHGKVEPKEGTIRASIARSPFDRKKFGVFLGGRKAETEYKVLKKKKGDYSFLELRPRTGRTHQIRVHLKYFGHPIVSDAKYAGRKQSRQDRKWCPRQFLHASRLVFTHPKSGEKMELTSPLPLELKKVLEGL